jgi:RHS repeat-associated protein
MRFLLLFLSLFLQFNVVNANIPQITAEQTLSIVTNYMGTPEAMYREDGEAVWKCELNSYGKVRKFQGKYVSDCPFRYQGQYEDAETGLCYNRFRYYSAEEGMYISQDPIRLYGERCNLYTYVANVNIGVDVFGLIGSYSSLSRQNRGNENVEVHHIPPRAAVAANNKPEYGTPAIVMSKEDHAKTASYGGGGKQYVNEQAASIANAKDNSYFEAMSRDIADVQGISHAYDDGLMDAIDYAEKKKMVTPEEAEKLRKQCQG